MRKSIRELLNKKLSSGAELLENIKLRKVAEKRAKHEAKKAYLRSYYASNLDKRKAWIRDNYASWKECCRLQQIKRRVRNIGEVTKKDIADLYIAQKGICGKNTEYGFLGCSAPVDGGYHIDHIIPVALGGTSWPENLQLLCPSCNLRKGAAHPTKWVKLLAARTMKC